MVNFLGYCLVVICLVLPVAGHADTHAIASSNEPVEVSADRLEASETSGSLVFIGNAVARQGEMTIYADRLTLHYSTENKEVERVEADGSVRIVHENRVATGEHAVFHRLEGRVVLTGSPKVSEGENFVAGHEVTLFLNENRSVVTGGEEGRVNAVFQPQAEAKP